MSNGLSPLNKKVVDSSDLYLYRNVGKFESNGEIFMAMRNEFVEYLLELLEPSGGVRAKAMFGGFGIYRDNLMFGLVADDILYFKVDKKPGLNSRPRDCPLLPMKIKAKSTLCPITRLRRKP